MLAAQNLIGREPLDDSKHSSVTDRATAFDGRLLLAGKETHAFLSRHPNRFQYVLTPKHGSWLNIVETLLGKMVRSFLRHTRVQSLDELKARILKGIGEINAALQRNAAVARQSLAQSEGLRGMDADKLVGEPLLFGRGVLLLMLIESVADGYVARLNLTDASAAWTFRARGGIHSLALNGNGSLVAAGKIGEVVIPHLSRPELAGPFQTLSQPIPPCSDIAEPNILAAQG